MINFPENRTNLAIFSHKSDRHNEINNFLLIYSLPAPACSEGSPTLLRGLCRKCRGGKGDLRRFCGVSVGGVGKKRGTSDTFAGFLSEVSRWLCGWLGGR